MELDWETRNSIIKCVFYGSDDGEEALTALTHHPSPDFNLSKLLLHNWSCNVKSCSLLYRERSIILSGWKGRNDHSVGLTFQVPWLET